MAIKTMVKESPFENTYGRLELHRDEKGRFFLLMDDPQGGAEWGPLTDKQVEAFNTLCEVPGYYGR
jgi:hypothetical protein